jgi:glycine/serine hydroxymethyltransferase
LGHFYCSNVGELICLLNGFPGNKVEKICELAHITLNKNAVFGDSSALSPGGVRIGKQ